jgi:predicted nucleic acid-binding protein
VTGWLLDTYVLSAFASGNPVIGPTIAEWFNQRSDELFLSAVTAAEIEAGISKLRRTGSGCSTTRLGPRGGIPASRMSRSRRSQNHGSLLS